MICYVFFYMLNDVSYVLHDGLHGVIWCVTSFAQVLQVYILHDLYHDATCLTVTYTTCTLFMVVIFSVTLNDVLHGMLYGVA